MSTMENIKEIWNLFFNGSYENTSNFKKLMSRYTSDEITLASAKHRERKESKRWDDESDLRLKLEEHIKDKKRKNELLKHGITDYNAYYWAKDANNQTVLVRVVDIGDYNTGIETVGKVDVESIDSYSDFKPVVLNQHF